MFTAKQWSHRTYSRRLSTPSKHAVQQEKHLSSWTAAWGVKCCTTRDLKNGMNVLRNSKTVVGYMVTAITTISIFGEGPQHCKLWTIQFEYISKPYCIRTRTKHFSCKARKALLLTLSIKRSLVASHVCKTKQSLWKIRRQILASKLKATDRFLSAIAILSNELSASVGNVVRTAWTSIRIFMRTVTSRKQRMHFRCSR